MSKIILLSRMFLGLIELVNLMVGMHKLTQIHESSDYVGNVYCIVYFSEYNTPFTKFQFIFIQTHNTVNIYRGLCLFLCIKNAILSFHWPYQINYIVFAVNFIYEVPKRNSNWTRMQKILVEGCIFIRAKERMYLDVVFDKRMRISSFYFPFLLNFLIVL